MSFLYRLKTPVCLPCQGHRTSNSALTLDWRNVCRFWTTFLLWKPPHWQRMESPSQFPESVVPAKEKPWTALDGTFRGMFSESCCSEVPVRALVGMRCFAYGRFWPALGHHSL